MTIEPRRLLHLLAVAEAGTFGKAAQHLRVTQPALSTSIAHLERSLGARLLERSRRGATLTEHGRLLCGRARAMRGLLEMAEDESRRLKLGQEGTLRIGVSPVGCVAVVPQAVARLAQSSPDAAITVSEMQDAALVEMLLDGSLDLAISPAGSRRDPKEIERKPLFHDRLVVALARTHPLARRRTLRLADLVDCPMVLPAPDTSLHRQIEGLFESAGASWPRLSLVSNSILFIKSMVQAGHALTIISDLMIEPEVAAGKVAAVPFSESAGQREICMRRWKFAPPNALLDRFVDCLQSVGRE